MLIDAYRPLIESAIRYSGGSHTYDDVRQMVESGTCLFWPGNHSVIVTETLEYPRRKVLHFFLASGNLPELAAMVPLILEWGLENGCTSATLLGRKGWQRTFLAKSGWTTSDLVLMEKEMKEIL